VIQRRHWTSEDDTAFVHRIAFDFVTQLEKRMEAMSLTQGGLAKKLGVSEGAVSQILNNPQNLTLKTIVAYARALGIKASIVAYDDNDPLNQRGPVNSAIFSTCWENAGKPSDFWSLNDNLRVVSTANVYSVTYHLCPVLSNYVGWSEAWEAMYKNVVETQSVAFAVPVLSKLSLTGGGEAHA